VKNVSVPGSTTVFTVIFQFLDEGVLFRKVNGFLASHHKYVARFAPLETGRHKQNCSMCFPFIEKQLLCGFFFPQLPANCLLMRDFNCSRAGPLGTA